MREVFFVKSENKAKAEELLKKDDLVSRQSIAVRLAGALGIDEDGYFIILEGSDAAIKRAEELLQDLTEKYDKKEKVLEKYDEGEENAMGGFGFVLGG